MQEKLLQEDSSPFPHYQQKISRPPLLLPCRCKVSMTDSVKPLKFLQEFSFPTLQYEEKHARPSPIITVKEQYVDG